jgi:DNA gyrase subunit A
MTELNIQSANLASQMKEDYLAYSMAVLLGRAIPDLYDGLKPAQRRVLQTMLEEGLLPEKRYVKAARVTGLTMAFYHPHGGCYGTLVNMATNWNNNIPWIDGHGNFGSTVDGPAAERYTECKLRPAAVDLLLQDKITWETRDNYDGSRQEAVRFNSAVPTVLLNGDSGIAVGFATKLAPHNLRSIAEATKVACKFPWTDQEAEANRLKAQDILLPDFPTGCDIVNDSELQKYKETGSGNIRCRAKVEKGLQKRDGRAKNRETLTFTCLPPGVNPEKLGEQIKSELEKGRIADVAEVVDESDRTGDRITVVAKAGANIEVLQNQLYSFTDLDTKYSAKTLVIDGTKPVEISPVSILQKWFGWRMDRLKLKFEQEQEVAQSRLHIVEGLLKAIDKLDAIIKKIRASANKTEAMVALTSAPFRFTKAQAEAILEMKLRQLTGLDASELSAEKDSLEEKLGDLHDLISEPTSRAIRIYKQLTELSKRHGEARRSAIVEAAPTAATPGPRGGSKATAAPAAAKPRFVKVDNKKGIVEQAKGPRGALVLDKADKLVLMTEDGTLKKVASNFKGTVSTAYSAVVLAKKESEVAQRKYLLVFTLADQLKAMFVDGADLCRVTSKGKQYLPEGAALIHFGENPYVVPFTSTRKKKMELTLSNTKQGKPGAKGVKIANLSEVKL